MSAVSQNRARIGPNAILQHLPVLDATIGDRLRAALLYRAGVEEPPPDAGMLPEDEVARLQFSVRRGWQPAITSSRTVFRRSPNA